MNKNNIANAFIRFAFGRVMATLLLAAVLTLGIPSDAPAQGNTGANPPSNGELIPAISISRPSPGQSIRPNTLNGANGYVHPQPGGASISNVKVVIHRTSGGGGDGYLNGSGAFVSNRYQFTADVRINAQGQQVWAIGFSFPSGDDIGQYGIQAVATDSAGLQGTANGGFTIEEVTPGQARVQEALEIINARTGGEDPWRDSWRNPNGGDQSDPNPIRNPPPTVARYTDCGRFVNAVVDGNGPFPPVGTGVQGPYIRDNWLNGSNMSDVRVGDVLWRNGHTGIYGGRTSDGGYIVLEASLEAGNGNGHGPQRDVYTGLGDFTMWGRPPGE